jgi:hypothetical protein
MHPSTRTCTDAGLHRIEVSSNKASYKAFYVHEALTVSVLTGKNARLIFLPLRESSLPVARSGTDAAGACCLALPPYAVPSGRAGTVAPTLESAVQSHQRTPEQER